MIKDKDEGVIEEIKTLGESVKTAVAKVDSITQTWQKDFDDLKEKVKSLAEPEKHPELYKQFEDIAEKIAKDQFVKRVQLGAEQPGKFKCFNPDRGYPLGADEVSSRFDGLDTKDLLTKGKAGFDEFLARPADDDDLKNFQKLADDIWILDCATRAAQGGNYRGFAETFPRMTRVWKNALQKLGQSYSIKQMDTVDAGQWIPIGMSSEFRALITAQLEVAALFERFPMPHSPWQLPVSLTDIVATKATETTGLVGAPSSDTVVQTLSLTAPTLTAIKTRVRFPFSEEWREDTIVPMLPYMRRETATGHANAEERTILDGDVTATHQDSDVTAASDARKNHMGIRKYSLAGTGTAFSSSLGTFTADALLGLPASMGEFGFGNQARGMTVYITGFVGLMRMMTLADTNGNPVVITVDKYGANAPILAGEWGKDIFGRPIIVSRYGREDLNASGVYDGTTTTKKYILCVNTRGFVIGDRREAGFELVRHAFADANEVVSFRRYAFNNMYGVSGAASARKTAWYGYNLA